MAMVAESSDENPNSSSDSSTGNNYSPNLKAKALGDDTKPWIDYAVHQAQLAQITVKYGFDSAVAMTRSRLERFMSTGTAHLSQTIDSIQEASSVYGVYEDIAFQKIKESVRFAAAHQVATCSAAVGLGLFTFKRPRRFLYYKTLRLFASEEALLSRADSKVKELRKSIDLLKAESDKLESMALQAEEEMMRGRTKLRQAGKQIQGVIRSAYKIERQARGLKDVLGELPRREASQFRSQVSNLASEAKRERNALGKEVSKISNYGISV